MTRCDITLPLHDYEAAYILKNQHHLQAHSVSRAVADILGVAVKKCRLLVSKKAPGYIVDQENLRYWGASVPSVLVDIFGQDIVTIAVLVKKGVPLYAIHSHDGVIVTDDIMDDGIATTQGTEKRSVSPVERLKGTLWYKYTLSSIHRVTVAVRVFSGVLCASGDTGMSRHLLSPSPCGRRGSMNHHSGIPPPPRVAPSAKTTKTHMTSYNTSIWRSYNDVLYLSAYPRKGLLSSALE